MSSRSLPSIVRSIGALTLDGSGLPGRGALRDRESSVSLPVYAATRRRSGHVQTVNLQCFNVRCTGSLDGEVTGACTGNTIKVKIIDA